MDTVDDRRFIEQAAKDEAAAGDPDCTTGEPDVSGLEESVARACDLIDTLRAERDKWKRLYHAIFAAYEQTLYRGPMNFDAFSKENRQRCEAPDGFNHGLQSWSLSDWFLAMVGEIGEAANVAKKLNRIRDGIRGNKESEAELRAKLRGELADGFIYLDLLAQREGIDLGAAVRDTFDAKSREIGYVSVSVVNVDAADAPK